MDDMDYIAINRTSWNDKTEIHFNSNFYDTDGFIKGKSSLNEIELRLLGDIAGKSVLHLQCHFGQDTISLNRLGADATGADLSDKAIEKARELAVLTNSDADFIRCDVYDLPNHLNKKFDIVYTSYGVIGWLPDINRWAAIVARYLKPGGKLIFVEFHPVVWMFDNEFTKVEYPYFNSGPIVENEAGTYADRNAALHRQSVTWNHGIGEVVTSLLKHEMEINALEEFDYSPYDCFSGTVQEGDRKFRIKHFGKKIPLVYSIVATRKGD